MKKLLNELYSNFGIFEYTRLLIKDEQKKIKIKKKKVVNNLFCVNIIKKQDFIIKKSIIKKKLHDYLPSPTTIIVAIRWGWGWTSVTWWRRRWTSWWRWRTSISWWRRRWTSWWWWRTSISWWRWWWATWWRWWWWIRHMWGSLIIAVACHLKKMNCSTKRFDYVEN